MDEEGSRYLKKPSPLTMLAVSEQYHGVLVDEDTSERVWCDVDRAAADVRAALEKLHSFAFDLRQTDTALAVQSQGANLARRIDALYAHLNALKLHMHEAAKNANDFYTLAIDVELSHRKPGHPLRPRGAPLQVDVRQTALGPETLIEDDTCATGEILQLSLF